MNNELENNNVADQNVTPVVPTEIPAAVPTEPVVSPTPVVEPTPEPVVVASVEEPVQPTEPVAPVEQPVPTPEPPVAPVQPTGQEPAPKKNGSVALIVAVLLLVGAIVFIIFLPEIPFFKENNSTNNSTNNTTNNTTNTTNTTDNTNTSKPDNNSTNKKFTIADYSGIFKSEKANLLLYSIDNENVHVSLDSDGYFFNADSELDNDKLTIKIFDNTTIFQLSDDKKTVTITSSEEQLNKITVTKERDITKEEIYADALGDVTLINSKYNGEFSNDKFIVQMVQTQKDELNVAITEKGKPNYASFIFEINSDGTITDDFFDDSRTLVLENGKVTITATKGSKEYDGTYTFVKNLTTDEILNIFAN